MGHRARKRFGQNFLHDPGVIHRIITAIHPLDSQHIVEIGPGQAALTDHLQAATRRLDVIELDRDLAEPLRQRFADNSGFHLHSADALRFDFSVLRTSTKLRIVGNLPYNISSPLLFHLLNQIDDIQDMHFMFQKEVAKRMAAEPNTTGYGRLSVMLQYYCDVESLFDIGPEAFNPPPKIDSAFVRLIPHITPPVQIDSMDNFSKVIAQAFSQKRKTLRNTLKPLFNANEITALDIDPVRRAETLSMEEFARLANAL